MTIEEIFALMSVDSMNIHQNISNLFSFFLRHQKLDRDLSCFHLVPGEMLLMPRTVNHKLDEHWKASFFQELIAIQNDIFDELEFRY